MPRLSVGQQKELITTLKSRFEKYAHRHKSLSWDVVGERLIANPNKLWSLNEMERTGGEPDVVEYGSTGELIFMDFSKESPKDRRNLCYDQQALAARKKFPPKDSAMNLAAVMGIELLTEEQYRELQTLGEFDTKTSSWLKTPQIIRKLGGAIYGDKRYNQVFVYHNGADSYYAARGFRGLLRI